MVRFPLSNSPVTVAFDDNSTPQNESQSVPRRVLIVDDNRDAAQSLHMLIELFGHQVRVADDDHEALKMASEFRPDIALVDIGLPGMNGYEVAREFRELPELSQMTLVASFGHGRPEDQERSIDAGFDQHCTKPISPEMLRTLLRSAERNRPDNNST